MGRPDLALHQLEGTEHRALRAAGAEGGRPRRQIAQARCRLGPMADDVAHLGDDGIGVDAGRPHLGKESREAVEHDLGGVFAGLGSGPLPSTRVWISARRSSTFTACSM